MVASKRSPLQPTKLPTNQPLLNERLHRHSLDDHTHTPIRTHTNPHKSTFMSDISPLKHINHMALFFAEITIVAPSHPTTTYIATHIIAQK
jgi:hypothetical protein